ncbi:CaiB/BaiF CoA transferase family protein [Nocardioides sp. CF8]|uniref:CaiB/BaiF CoA transferase family protein n=1 Tax=Nocardioides sp. CF8 TaxID=110319 RepID=UPI000560C037|nr:CaiB/BaiF CoA-transferase family protein [Nocardioides sp. CF8]
MSGPLTGLRVLELGGKGPVPFCGMVLGDLGAEVIRIDRAGEHVNPVLNRGRRSIQIDLKSSSGVDATLRLASTCDVVLEGFRPGVIERLGIGPGVMLERRPQLVVGRMTGWGQDGPWAGSPGHDINYIAQTGVLHSIGEAGGPPVIPLNLVADMGGGGMLLVAGVLAGVIESRISGKGQVVDAAMVDGSAILMAMMYGFLADGSWQDQRGVNRLDGGRPWYAVYACADGYIAVGCIETQFWVDFVEQMALSEDPDFADQHDSRAWPAMQRKLSALFAEHNRAEWERRFPSGRACVTPVLSMVEATQSPHNLARSVFAQAPGGGVWPQPAPRFSRTPPASPTQARKAGQDTIEVLLESGFGRDEIDQLMGHVS